MLIAGIAWVLAPLLLVIMPPDASYWTYVFPSMLLATVGIDISFSLTNIYIMNCARESELGIAGAVISSNLHLAIALCLGLAEVVRSQTRKSLVKSGKKDGEVTLGVLRAVFVYEVVLAAVALVVIVLGVRMKKAGSELTEDERRRKLEGGGGGSEGSSREEFSVGAGMVVVRDEVCDEDASGLATATWRPESEDET